MLDLDPEEWELLGLHTGSNDGVFKVLYRRPEGTGWRVLEVLPAAEYSVVVIWGRKRVGNPYR